MSLIAINIFTDHELQLLTSEIPIDVPINTYNLTKVANFQMYRNSLTKAINEKLAYMNERNVFVHQVDLRMNLFYIDATDQEKLKKKEAIEIEVAPFYVDATCD